MNKVLPVILFIVSPLFANGQVFDDIDWEIGVQPWFLPVSIDVSKDGLGLSVEKGIKFPWGEISFEVSTDIAKTNERKDKIQFKDRIVEKPIYIEVPRYVPGPTRTITKTVIKVKEVVREVVHRQFIVELRNFNGKSSQEFIITGVDALILDVEGRTGIEARAGRLIVDLTHSKLKSLHFKGVAISEEANLENKLNKILIGFNDKTGQIYQYDDGKSCQGHPLWGRGKSHADGLLVVSDFEQKIGKLSTNTHYKSDFEYLQNLRTRCGVNYKFKSLACTEDIIFTSGGIGMLITPILYKKGLIGKEKQKKGEKKWVFFGWSEFINLKFGKPANGNTRTFYLATHNGKPSMQVRANHSILSASRIKALGLNRPEKQIGFTNNQLIELFCEIQDVLTNVKNEIQH